jgi:nucleoside-diphosphate-sugar epimerase
MSIAYVAGATGYTGRAVVRMLIEAGVETHAHIRPDAEHLDAWRQRFMEIGAHVDTTAWDAQALTDRLTELGPIAVFGCLGTTKKRIARDANEGKTSSYAVVDYGMTVMLHSAAEACGTNPRFVYVSSAGSKPGGEGSYLGARWAVEQVLIKSSLPYTIARPCFITGPDRDEDRPAERIGAMVSDSVLSLIGAFGAKGVQERYRSTTNTILGAALSRLAFEPAAECQIIESEGLR